MTFASERSRTLVTRLNRLSVQHAINPHRLIDWSAQADSTRFAFPPTLSSLRSLPIYDEISDETRWKLHLAEANHFFSLNIHGERELMLGIVDRLGRENFALLTEYMHHFLHEENAHSMVFRAFCHRYGKVYPNRTLSWAQPEHFQSAGVEDFVFFARVFVFEEIAIYFNRHIASDSDLWSVSRAINRYHADEETRHLAFGRQVLADLWSSYAGEWSPTTRQQVAAYIRAYIEQIFASLVDPLIFSEAGIAGDLYQLRQQAVASTERAELRQIATKNIRQLMEELGVWTWSV